MNALQQTYTLLAEGLQSDPQLCLASVVTWLDPMWKDADEDWGIPPNEDGTLEIALCVTRKAFPDVYVQAVEAIRRGASYAELDRLICDEITARGIPLESLEWIGYGVPTPAFGAVLEDTDFYTSFPDAIMVMACFGVSPEPNRYNIVVPDCVYTAGRMIADDLENQEGEHYRQLSWLMQWLFSYSGNSSVDLDYETMCEIEPLSWEPENVAFAIEIVEEANGIMADAMAGLTFLSSQPELLAILQRNVQRIYKAMDLQKNKRDEPKVRLKWECIR
ncbi:MAG: hypothetical protein RLP44_29880 [Aggregatilineales bacterium]